MLVLSAPIENIKEKEFHSEKYQKIVTDNVIFEMPIHATHIWMPDGYSEDRYEVIIHNLSIRNNDDYILKVSWEDKGYIDETIQIHYNFKGKKLKKNDIHLNSLSKYDKSCLDSLVEGDNKNNCEKSQDKSKLKFKNVEFQLGTIIGYETIQEFYEDGYVDVDYPIYEWVDFSEKGIEIENLPDNFLAIDDIEISACGDLNAENGVYTQTAMINYVAPFGCINFHNKNITFNMNGFMINNTNTSTGGVCIAMQKIAGMSVWGASNTIKNGILKGGDGIFVHRNNNSIIENMTFLDQNYLGKGSAIQTADFVNNLTIRNVKITNSSLAGFYFNGDHSTTNIYNMNISNSNYAISGVSDDNNSINVFDSIFELTILEDIHIFNGNGNEISLINCSYTSGENITIDNKLNRKWHFNVQTNYSNNGTAVDGATINAYNSSGQLQFSKLTDNNGQIGNQQLIEYTNINNVKSYSYNKYTINTSINGYDTNSTILNITSSQIFSVSLSDTTFPLISITSPSNNSNNLDNTLDVNYTFSDTNLDSCWWTNDSGVTNKTLTCGNNITGQTWEEGSNTIIIYINDTTNNINSSSVTFFVDSINPDISIVYPLNTTYTSIQTELNYTSSDSVSLDSCWYSLNLGVYNTTITCGDNVTSLNSGQGSSTWFIYSNDSANNINSSSVTFFVDSTLPTFTTIPSNEGITYPTQWDGVDFDATDETGFDSYVVNNSDFTINDSGYLNTTLILGVGVYNLNITINDTSNNINSTIFVLTVNQEIPEGSLTSDLGWTINETQSVTIGLSESQTGDNDLTYIVYRDGVSKTTGETWSPSLGTYDYVLNTTGGVNWTANASMDTQTLTVNDNINPNIEIVYPTNNTNHSEQIEINYTFSDTNLDSCWWTNDLGKTNTILTDCGTNITGQTWIEGINNITIYANDSGNNINSSSVTFFVDSIAPSIIITNPLSAIVNNNSISLNYSVLDDGVGVDTCIYRVYNSSTEIIANTTISDCLNTTFEMPGGDVDYNLTMYVNDSLGNLNTKIHAFSIRTDSPAIIINSPIDNQWLNYNTNIYFNFTATDLDGLDTCQLWGDWTGTWHKNYTWVNAESGVMNWTTQNITLGDGDYTWLMKCNDTFGNVENTSAYNFNLDTITPNLTLNSITTTTGSQIISFNSSASDENSYSCKYSIFDLAGGIDGLSENLTFECNNVTDATLSTFATFNLTIYVNDSAGNENITSQLFTTVATSDEGGSTGGGGSTTVIIGGEAGWNMMVAKGIAKYDTIMVGGTSRRLSISFENVGDTSFVVDLHCEDLIGNACQYVEFEENPFTIPLIKDIQTRTYFNIVLPESVIEEDFIFNIVAQDQKGRVGTISVDLGVGKGGVLSTFVKVGLRTSGGFPYWVIFMGTLFLSIMVLGFSIPNKFKGKVFIVIFGSLLISFLVLNIF